MIAVLRRIKGILLGGTSSTGQPNSSPLIAYIDPAQLAAPELMVRLGTKYGGWLIPAKADLTADSVCYLAGAGEDISFDCALARIFHCQVRIVDPTPRAIDHFRQLDHAIREGRNFPINNSSAEFYDISASDFARLLYLPAGLSDRDVEMKFFMPRNPAHVSCSTVNLQNTDDYFTAQCYRLKTLMEAQCDPKIELLKIDIEGAEYGVIQDILNSNLLPRLLLVEFDEIHHPLDDNFSERVRKHINLLVDAGMTCIAVDGPNATFINVSKNKL